MNFSLFSKHASGVILGFFYPGKTAPFKEFPLNREGDIWFAAVDGVPEGIEYAFRCKGPFEHFWLIDPYTKTSPRSKVERPAAFDWQGIKKPKIPLEELLIYEMHVRGFTKHASSGVSHPGTYLGMIEKIPYLKKLGINAVQLLPIFAFDWMHSKTKDLPNYWGYNPLHFFTPMHSYASTDAIFEFKTLVKELHRNGIEVLLDVVYNHTGEGKDPNYVVNFRGIDHLVYYMIDEKGNYLDFTGCENTFNCNHPQVQTLILDSLRYWIEEMQVDGFRFDLASIFTRDQAGHPMQNPPLLEAIKTDPIISAAKLIAESWDAAGLYQLGKFPEWGPWSEWNGFFRDSIRKFMKGEAEASSFANALLGSDQIYKSPLHSINFVTAHDGFCLRDLVSYQKKHNLANGEMNRDGSDCNHSWNCGAEGETEDLRILDLRERQMRNFLLALMVSQGIPMLLMGDEYGHTRKGNNNPYVLDNEINWFLWDELEKNQKIFDFVRLLIAIRKTHFLPFNSRHFKEHELTWHNHWDVGSRFIAFSNASFFVAFNAHHLPKMTTLPKTATWRQFIHTAFDWDKQPSDLPMEIELPSHSALLAIS